MIIRTASQKAMLRAAVAMRQQGHVWLSLAEIGGEHGRPYDRQRTASSLVNGGFLERGPIPVRVRPGGSQVVYRATPAGIEWVMKDRLRDSLGRRRGGSSRPRLSPESITRARQLLAERVDGRRKYTVQEVAEMIGVNRDTLRLYLNPNSRIRRNERRRK